MSDATWDGAPERLDRVIAALDLARSRSHAAELITGGSVHVDGKPVTKSGQRVRTGARIDVTGTDHYVSRAAHKLRSGLSGFGIDPAGRLSLDLGASTGGFTQVLLEQGARAVQAIDVGHGQMVDTLRADPRVHLVEGCNARDLTAEMLARDTEIPERPELVVADLSFISLTLVIPAIAATADEAADLVLLIKPQFEVGRGGIQDGIVVSNARRADAIRSVLRSAAEHGYDARGLTRSPIAGSNGNIEYLVHFQRTPAPNPTEWEACLPSLSEGAPSTRTHAEGEA